MGEVFTLALPFFGLIFLGFLSGKIAKLPETGLAWLNFFVVYIALPALFFRLVSKTPVEELTNWSFVLSTTFITYTAFAISFAFGLWVTGGKMAEATIQGLAGSYSNIGYMGPGLTLAALGPAATVPTALIFCFDSILLFTLIPVMMALSGTERLNWRETVYFGFEEGAAPSIHSGHPGRRTGRRGQIPAAHLDQYHADILERCCGPMCAVCHGCLGCLAQGAPLSF